MEILVESKQQTELFNSSFYWYMAFILTGFFSCLSKSYFHAQGFNTSSTCVQVYFAGLGCLKNVRAALCRGRVLKCSRCGRPGATIGCRVDRCPKTYHLVSKSSEPFHTSKV